SLVGYFVGRRVGGFSRGGRSVRPGSGETPSAIRLQRRKYRRPGRRLPLLPRARPRNRGPDAQAWVRGAGGRLRTALIGLGRPGTPLPDCNRASRRLDARENFELL